MCWSRAGWQCDGATLVAMAAAGAGNESAASGRSVYRTLSFTAKLSKSQHRRVDHVMAMCCEMYNALLESWRTGYRFWKFGPDHSRPKPRFNKFEHYKMLTDIRRFDDRWGELDTNVGRAVIDRCHGAIDGFYNSGRGYPRFRSTRRWRSIVVKGAHGGMVVPPKSGGKWWTLKVKGLPRIKFDAKRLNGLDYDVVELRIVRSALRVQVQVVIKETIAEEQRAPLSQPSNPVGIDAGIKQRFTFSDGAVIPKRSHDRKAIKRKQRELARAKMGSNSRRKKARSLAKEHERQAESRRNEDFRLVADIIKKYDGFAVEDLRVQNMMRNRRLSDLISQQGWGAFYAILEQQAARAGSWFVRVSPLYTSQTCSQCGHVLEDKLTLSERVFVCPACGHSQCRDVNAASNICARGFPSPGPGGDPPACAAGVSTTTERKTPSGRGLCTRNDMTSPRSPGHYSI